MAKPKFKKNYVLKRRRVGGDADLKSAEASAATGDISTWKAERVVHEHTGVTYLGITFDHTLSGRIFRVFDFDLSENPTKLRLALRKAGAAMLGFKKDQLKALGKLLRKLHPDAKILCTKPGFRPGAFILGSHISGPSRDSYRWSATDSVPLGARRGSLASWQANVAKPIGFSTYASFAILTGLGACLPGYIENRRLTHPTLPRLSSETSGCNYSGPSGVGKSTSGLAVAGLYGSPQVCDWDFKPTALEERLAAKNDLALVLDDTETYTDAYPKLSHQIHLVNQKVSGGKSKGRSQVVADKPYADLKWCTFCLSSSPKPIDDILALDGIVRSKGEKVRYFDIAVPSDVDGGIFDQIPAGHGDVSQASTKLIQVLEIGIASNYGTAMPAFIDWMMAKDRTATVVKYWSEFLRIAQTKGWDVRYAKKFAIPYAAGRLAIDAGLLPWTEDWVRKAVLHCYRKAQAGIAHDKAVMDDKLKGLLRDFKDPTKFPVVTPGQKQPVRCTAGTWGIATTYKGQQVMAVRKDKLQTIAGSNAGGKELIKRFDRSQSLIRSNPKDSTMQLPVPLEINGKVTAKPRFFIIDPTKAGVAAAT